jgi:hypothetical protein
MGPFDIEAVVDPIGVKISDAIMNFQGAGYEVTSKVFQDCGTPRVQKRQTSSGYAYGRPAERYGAAATTLEADESKLKVLIKDIKEALHQAKGFWTQLPSELCADEAVGSGSVKSAPAERGRNGRQQQATATATATAAATTPQPVPTCWNGKDAGRYQNAVVSDGLVHQEFNPEVRVDVSRPDVDINEQIFALKLITKKLENAYNGQPVEWPTVKSKMPLYGRVN